MQNCQQESKFVDKKKVSLLSLKKQGKLMKQLWKSTRGQKNKLLLETIQDLF
jgi:hypothetical protein